MVEYRRRHVRKQTGIQRRAGNSKFKKLNQHPAVVEAAKFGAACLHNPNCVKNVTSGVKYFTKLFT
jgi:hypothetical protein